MAENITTQASYSGLPLLRLILNYEYVQAMTSAAAQVHFYTVKKTNEVQQLTTISNIHIISLLKMNFKL